MKTHCVFIHTSRSIHRFDLCVRSGSDEITLSRPAIHIPLPNARVFDLGRLLDDLPTDRHAELSFVTPLAWSGVVELERELADQLTDEQVEHAIALEAEYESEIGATTSRCAIRRLEGRDPCWAVTQVPENAIVQMQDVVRKAKATSFRIAALPDELDRARDVQAVDEVERFALAWLGGQLLDNHQPPALFVIDHRAERRRKTAVVGAAATVAVATCAIWHIELNHQLTRADELAASTQSQLSDLSASELELTSQLRDAANCVKNRDEAALERMRLIKLQVKKKKLVVQERRAIPELLKALATASTEAVWLANLVVEIKGEHVVATVDGLAVSPLDAANFASSVEACIQDSQGTGAVNEWSVQTSSIDSQGAIVAFELSIVRRALATDESNDIAHNRKSLPPVAFYSAWRFASVAP